MSNFIYDPSLTIQEYLEELYNKHLANSSGVSFVAELSSGQLYNIQNLSGTLLEQLSLTGDNLQNQIGGGTVSSINTKIGLVTLQGAGDISVTNDLFLPIITISGDISGLYSKTNPNNYSNSGNLYQTGFNILSVLGETGQNLNNKIGILSGQVILSSQTGGFYRDNINQYSTSGNLLATGSSLQNQLISISGDLLSYNSNLNAKVSTVSGLTINQLTGISITGSQSLVGLARISGVGNINISQLGNNLVISGSSAGGAGESNTISNIGDGSGVFAQKIGVDLQLKSLKPGNNISIIGDNDSLTINSSSSESPSVEPMIVPFSLGPVTWTNMPAAVSFFGASSAYVNLLDLSSYTGVRLVVNKTATAGAAASALSLKYLGHFSTTPAQYLNIDTNNVQTRVNVQNTYVNSGWQPLVNGARSGVFVALIGAGGDGALDPVFGSIMAQFR